MGIVILVILVLVIAILVSCIKLYRKHMLMLLKDWVLIRVHGQ